MKKTILLIALLISFSLLPARQAQCEPLLDYEGGWNLYLKEPENSATHFAVGVGGEYLMYKLLDWLDLDQSLSRKSKIIVSTIGVSVLALMGETIIYPDGYSPPGGNPNGWRNIRDFGMDLSGIAVGTVIAINF